MQTLFIVATVLAWLVFLGLAYYLAYRIFIIHQRSQSPYREGHMGYYRIFSVSKTYTTKTLAGFKVQYRLDVQFERVNNEEFKRARMLEDSSQVLLAREFNQRVFLPFLDDNSCFFAIDWCEVEEDKKLYHVFRSPVRQIVDEDTSYLVQEFHDTLLRTKLATTPFEEMGCKTMCVYFERNIFPDELIEENYAMIPEDVRQTILQDERYGAWEELLAVAAMKRRLEFFRNQKKQLHESGLVSIETDAAGRGLRIKWHFKDDAPSGYDLVGMRKQGGFFRSQWDIENNGTWVIQSSKDGETTEFLDEGQTYFYTFVLQPWKENEKSKRYAVARFQVTMEMAKEREEVEATLKRLEARKPVVDPDKQHISRAIKELGLYVELDSALEAKTRAWEKEIRENVEYSAEQKAEKIERLRETMTELRSKYEP